jgi:hypothetical protein
MLIQKFLNLLGIYEQKLLEQMKKDLIGKKVVMSKDGKTNDNDVLMRYAEYQVDFIEINTIREFFKRINESDDKALLTDFIKFSEILEELPMTPKERAQIIIEAFKKNTRSGILSVDDFSTSFVIDANKIVTVKFKTISDDQIFKMFKSGTILDFIYQDEENITPEVRAQIDELIDRKDEYCLDTIKIYDDTLRLYELLIEKDGKQTDAEIALVGKIMLSNRLSQNNVDDVIKYLTNKRNKQLEKQAKKEASEFVVVKPKVEEVKKSNLVTEKEYRQIKKEIRQYYDLYHMEIVSEIDYETMIRLTSLMLRIGINKDEIKRFISKVKDTFVVSDNAITNFVHEYDRLNYYFEDYDLKNILEYLEEIFICSDEDYLFWKDEIEKELDKLLSRIAYKYDYELEVAKKRLSI